MDEIGKRARELADRVLNIGLIYEGGGEIDGALSRAENAAQELLAALSAAPQVPEGWVLVPRDCIGAVRVARLAMLEKEDRADELMDAAMYADAASDLKKIIDAAKSEKSA